MESAYLNTTALSGQILGFDEQHEVGEMAEELLNYEVARILGQQHE